MYTSPSVIIRYKTDFGETPSNTVIHTTDELTSEHLPTLSDDVYNFLGWVHINEAGHESSLSERMIVSTDWLIPTGVKNEYYVIFTAKWKLGKRTETITDKNTTYELVKNGNVIALEGSDGSHSEATDDAPTKTSELENDSGYLTAETDPIFKASPAADITSGDIEKWNNKAETDAIPTKVGQLANDASYATQSEAKGYADAKDPAIAKAQSTADTAASNLETFKGTVSSTYETKTDATGKLSEAKGYTDTKIAYLINGAPTTLDTLKEIADAMEESAEVVEALDKAIGTKANASDLTSHVNNTSNPHGVTKEQVGLGNVDNTADANKSVKYAVSAETTTKLSYIGLGTSGSNANMIKLVYEWTISNLYAGCTGLYAICDNETKFNGLLSVRFRNFDSATKLGGHELAWIAASRTPPKAVLTYTINESSITYRLYIYYGSAWRTLTIAKITEIGTAGTLVNSVVTGLNGTTLQEATQVKVDYATNAGRDGSGNNIVNTYATKAALNSYSNSIDNLQAEIDSIQQNKTTYELVKNGSVIALEGSDGSYSEVEDDNTTYSLGSFGITATAAELNYMDGVTSNVQTQLNGKATRISLGGQCQKTDYSLSVIALCYAPTTASTTNSSYTVGRISVARSNNLNPPKFVDIAMGAAHGAIGRIRTRYTRTDFAVFEPCTFTYNGVLYGGVKFNPDASNYGYVEFTGVTTFPIFALDIYNTSSKAILNEEVYNSLSSSTVIVSHDLYLGDNAFITSANIGSQSVASATKATQDGSGNNIVNTYATKSALNSAVNDLSNAIDNIDQSQGKDGNGNDIAETYATKGELSGKANSSHTHTKSQITDFPTSLPASDVYAWAKASAKPSYSWSEITGKPSTFTPASHDHTYLKGVYTANGGSQPPSYVGANAVKCNMMQQFVGTDVTSFGYYADVLQMNAYSWSDVPYATALAIQKTNGIPRAWIAAGGNTDKWAGATEIITKNNIGSQSVNYATSAGSASSATKATQDGNGNTIATYYMKRGTYERIQGTSSARKNLNNYTTAGFYNVKTAYVDNCPSGIGIGAALLVYPWDSSGYECQEITETAACTTSRRWIRHKTGSTWTAWVELVTSQNIGSFVSSGGGTVVDITSSVSVYSSYGDHPIKKAVDTGSSVLILFNGEQEFADINITFPFYLQSKLCVSAFLYGENGTVDLAATEGLFDVQLDAFWSSYCGYGSSLKIEYV